MSQPPDRLVRATVGGMNVRPMLPTDYQPAWQAILDGGWADFRQSLRFYLRFAPAQIFVAETPDGRIVGTASAIQHADTGWIGMVFVAPAWRGRGLGGVLTRLALQRLQELGCRSVLLAATELGRPIYERLGFVASGGYTVLSSESAGLETPAHPSVRSLHPGDLDAVCRLDRRASGENRRAALAALGGATGQGWALGTPTDLRGYALRTAWGLGPAVAFKAADGEQLLDVLLWHRHADGRISLTVPTDNHPARAHLVARGFREQRHLPRMLLGESVPWHPEAIWAIFNFAMG